MDVHLNAASCTCKLESITNTGDIKFLYTDKLCGVSFNNNSEYLIGLLIKTIRWWEIRDYSPYIDSSIKTPCIVTYKFMEAGHMPG